MNKYFSFFQIIFDLIISISSTESEIQVFLQFRCHHRAIFRDDRQPYQIKINLQLEKKN